MKKVFIGFSVDMDRAYSPYNIHGNLINELHSEYITNNYYYKNFVENTQRLFDYFYKNGYQKSVTWFVNESDYNITIFHKNILQQCVLDGEIGLHTHFNSTKYNADLYSMSTNPSDWFEKGLKLPTERLENFTNKKPFCFKAGNHMRNKEMFEAIATNDYVIDCTMVINDINIKNEIILFDDSNLKLGTQPFFIKTKNKYILEIPEIRVNKIINHIKECFLNGNNAFIKLQIHHWQYDELIPEFDNLINILKDSYDFNFVSLEEMMRIHFNEIMLNENKYILNHISTNLKNDNYYLSLSTIYDKNMLDLVIYIFKNFKNNTKFIELFSGIGQFSYLLSKFGFESLTILDFDQNRLDHFDVLKSVCADFFSIDLSSYDCVFMTNSINTTLCDQIDTQIRIYEKFLSSKIDNTLILNYLKYGDYSLIHSKKIIQYFENKYDVIYLNCEYVIIKNNIIEQQVEPFSKIFKSYKLINFTSVYDEIINVEKKNIIRLSLNDNTNSSFGIYFPIYDYKVGLKNGDCILEFKCKSDKKIKIKIYTGSKWIKLDNEINENYQTIVLKENFIFDSKSTYRIGFYDISDNTNVYITDIDFYEQ